MKNILVALLFLGAFTAEAAPYYRFWRGFKKPELTTKDFNKAIEDVFVEATVENGAGKGLVAYIPGLPNKAEDIALPDEVALIVYESKEKYDALKATSMGKAYTNLHWDYFTRAPQTEGDPVPENISKSAVPIPFTREIARLENGVAYDLFNSDADWKSGAVKLRFFKRNSSETLELESIRQIQKDYAEKADAYLVLADTEYLMIYELWKNEVSYDESGIQAFYEENFKPLGDNQIEAKKSGDSITGLQDLSFEQGEAVNAQFDSKKEVAHFSEFEIEAAVEVQIKDLYPTLIEYEFDTAIEKAGVLTKTYIVKYEDEQGVPVIHEDLVEFKFEKSRLHPEQLYLQTHDAEVIR
ncbi:MAG: hypothetical protein R3A80_01280 [Bdellovibrionota bacterium]